MASTTLRRIYLFSDTYGRSKNPFLQDDADAIVSTDFRSFPLEPIQREFDIYGRESVTEHMLRLIVELSDATAESKYMPPGVVDEFKSTYTGVFINAAPRLNKTNGAPFYVATAGRIRIVTTNPAALSTIKDRIETLHHLNNESNIVYGPTEQFRSSYTPSLLYPDHGIDLIEDDINTTIPDYPNDQWELAYIDRFGNMITYCNDVEKQWKQIEAATVDGKVKLVVGNVSQTVEISTSLRDAEPGALVVYKNKNIDILRKWMAEEDSYTRLYKSSYFQFAKPEIGARIKVVS